RYAFVILLRISKVEPPGDLSPGRRWGVRQDGPHSAPPHPESPGSALSDQQVGGRFFSARGARNRRSPHRRLAVAAKRRMDLGSIPGPIGASMRFFLLAAAAGLLATTSLASPAFARPQSPETAPLPHRQGLSMEMPVLAEDAALQAAVASSARPAADRARDGDRRRFETLTLWGLRPGLTVVEIEPGRAGWWRNILEPYAAATGGRYVPVNRPLEGMGVEDGTADLVVTARAYHNWARDGRAEPYLAAFFQALKPGGVLAVEQH